MLDQKSRVQSPESRRFRSGTRVILIAAAGLVGGAALRPAGIAAQESGDGEPRIGCLRGQRIAHCRTFWLLEMQGFTPLTQSSRVIERGGLYSSESTIWDTTLEWNVGHMWNLNRDWAVGGTLTASTAADGVLSGIRGRTRRWLSDDVSIETSLGYIRTDAHSFGRGNDHGASVDLRLNIRDQGAFFLRWDHLSLPETTIDGFGQTYYDPGGAQNALLVGIGAGSVPALVGTGTLVVAFAVLLGIYIATDAS